MKHNRTLLALFSVMLIASMLLASCAPAPAAAPAAPTDQKKGGQLVWVDSGSYYTLDPFVTPWHAIPQYSVFDTQATLKPDFSGYVGDLLSSWEAAKDNLSLTAKLTKGAKFQDGTPVDAAAIKWNWDMYLDEKLASPGGGDARDNVKEVIVVDPETIKIVLKNPYAPIYSVLAALEIASPTAYKTLGADKFAQTPVGAGPWKVKTIVANTSILYERFADYAWGPSFADNKNAVYPDTLLIKYVDDESVRYASLETGEVQVAPVPPQFLAKAKANANIQIQEGVETGITYIGFNNEFKPFDDINVRQAISLAVNRDELVKVGYEGEAVPSYGPLSPAEFGFSQAVEDKGKAASNDVEKAKSMLDAAGYKAGADGIRVDPSGKKMDYTLDVAPNAANQRMAETFQAQMQKIGIKLTLEVLESQVIKDKTVKGTHQMIFWNYAMLDASILTYIFHSSRIGASNRNRVVDKDLDKLLEAADQELDPVARATKVQTVCNYLVDKRYHLPLLTVKAFTGFRKDLVAGLKFNKDATPIFQDAYMLKK